MGTVAHVISVGREPGIRTKARPPAGCGAKEASASSYPSRRHSLSQASLGRQETARSVHPSERARVGEGGDGGLGGHLVSALTACLAVLGRCLCLLSSRLSYFAVYTLLSTGTPGPSRNASDQPCSLHPFSGSLFHAHCFLSLLSRSAVVSLSLSLTCACFHRRVHCVNAACGAVHRRRLRIRIRASVL